MTYRACKALALVALLGVGAPAVAQTLPSWRLGIVQVIYADPSDVVIQLDVVGPCGSNLYHIRRSNVNFREMTDLALTTFQRDAKLGLYVTLCAGTRNIIDHGYITH